MDGPDRGNARPRLHAQQPCPALAPVPLHQSLPRVRTCLCRASLRGRSPRNGCHAAGRHAHSLRGRLFGFRLPAGVAARSGGRRRHGRGVVHRVAGPVLLGERRARNAPHTRLQHDFHRRRLHGVFQREPALAVRRLLHACGSDRDSQPAQPLQFLLALPL